MAEAALDRRELAAIARAQKANPLKYYVPRDCAVPFFYCTTTIQGCIGGNRSTKTATTVARACMALTGIEPDSLPSSLECLFGPEGYHPGVTIRHWCEDFTVVRDVILPLYHWLLPPSLIDESNGAGGYNTIGHTLRMKDGSFVEFKTYTRPIVKGESAARRFVIFDEIPRGKLFRKQIMRVATEGGYMWIAATPENIAPYDTSWFERVVMRGKGKTFSVFELNTDENLQKMADEVGGFRGERIAQIRKELPEILSDDEFQTAVFGKSAWRSGVVFQSFDDELHGYALRVAPDQWRELAAKGYGDVVGGFDAGGSMHPTAVPYLFHVKPTLPDEAVNLLRPLKLAPNDSVIFWEYTGKGFVPDHLPQLLANHRRFRPLEYWADSSMWDEDMKRGGDTVAQMYWEAGIAPLQRANKQVAAGINLMTTLLMPRDGEAAADWPILRIVIRDAPDTAEALRSWGTKRNVDDLPPNERYSQAHKDPVDALRYACMGIYGSGVSQPVVIPQVPVDPYTGVPLDMVLSLANMRLGI